MTDHRNVYADWCAHARSQHREFVDELKSLLEKHHATIEISYDSSSYHHQIVLILGSETVSENYSNGKNIEIDQYNLEEKLC